MCADVAANLIAFQDPPGHIAPRRLMATALQSYLKRREAMIREVADEILARLRGRGQLDYATDFAEPFAATCIARIMGFPDKDIPLLLGWSNLFFYMFHAIPDAATLERVDRALVSFRVYVREALNARRTAPRDDLLTLLMEARRGDHELADQEVVDNAMLLTADGIENVQAGLTGTVATLLSHPASLARVLDNPSLLPAAIDECLRFESPGQYQARIALETLTIGDATIRANSVVLVGLAAANRDPAVFGEPDHFNIDRHGPRHLAFGLGRHACIGGALVMEEMAAAILSLFDGSRRVAMRHSELTWVARAGHRWPASLMLDVVDLLPAY